MNLTKRKNSWRKTIAGGLCVCAVLIGLPAAEAADTGTAWRNLFYVEGVPVKCENASGQTMPYISYGGSVYVTLRSVGEWMGKDVGWDAATQTVTLSGSKESQLEANSTYAPQTGTLEVVSSPNMTIQVDGTVRTFTGADGNPVYPLVYQDTTYLPVRAVGELLGKEVEWSNDGDMQIIRIQNAMTDSQTEQLETYVRAALPLVNTLIQTRVQLQNCPDDAEQALTLCAQIQDILDELSALERPRVTSCSMQYEELDGYIERICDRMEQFEAAVQGGATPEESYSILDASQPGSYDYLGDLELQAKVAELGGFAGLTVDLGEYGNGEIVE